MPLCAVFCPADSHRRAVTGVRLSSGTVYRVENTGPAELLMSVSLHQLRAGLEMFQAPAAACPVPPPAPPRSALQH